MAPDLTKVYTELERWGKVPERREPFTLEMLADINENFGASGLGPDCKLAALVDWFEVSLLAGSRLSEWAQDAHQAKLVYDIKKRSEKIYESLHLSRLPLRKRESHALHRT